jgi:hypothetical protein
MNKKFSWRAFISFALTYIMVILLLSGIMLYVAPPGRYAHWVNWTLWGFSKEGWQGIHIIFSVGFVLLSVLHLLWINWKAFLSYLKSKSSSGFNKKRELITSTLLIFVFFFGTIYGVPPFKNILDFGDKVTESWEKVEERAPVPHAEQLTLNELAEQMRLSSVDEITRKLKSHKVVFENTNKQTLQEIGVANNLTPIEVYEIILKKAVNQKEGSGIGRKTVEDFAVELNKSVDEIMKIFKANDIEAKPTQTLRTIGENNNLPPRDVYKLISE